jgi:hypothetical protein
LHICWNSAQYIISTKDKRDSSESLLITPTHTSINIMKNSFVAGLTLLSVLLATASSTKAELAPQINSLTIRNIERSNTQERANPSTEQSNPQAPANTPRRKNNRQVATNTQRSMKYVKLGWDAQQGGDKDQALLYYYKAVKADKTNAYAFMAAGNLLGHNEDGHTCMKAAVALFQAQGNKEGYTAAVNWLQEGGESE